MGGELRDVEVFVACFFEETVGDSVVDVNGECDVEEVDGSRWLCVCPSDAVDFHVFF